MCSGEKYLGIVWNNACSSDQREFWWNIFGDVVLGLFFVGVVTNEMHVCYKSLEL